MRLLMGLLALLPLLAFASCSTGKRSPLRSVGDLLHLPFGEAGVERPKVLAVRRDGRYYVVTSRKKDSSSEKAPAVDSLATYPKVVVPSAREVERFVTSYVTTDRLALERLFERREIYRPQIEPVFRGMGLPSELINIALLESGFDPDSRSNRGAVGMWQFVASTARLYGLRVSLLRDERRDVSRSTVAAAKYLADLHDKLGDWSLAIAAYNCGDGGIRRAVEAGGTRDVFVLARRGILPEETADFVARFFALTKISYHPEAFGVQNPFAVELAS